MSEKTEPEPPESLYFRESIQVSEAIARIRTWKVLEAVHGRKGPALLHLNDEARTQMKLLLKFEKDCTRSVAICELCSSEITEADVAMVYCGRKTTNRNCTPHCWLTKAVWRIAR